MVCPSAETGEQLVELYIEHEPDVIFWTYKCLA